MVADRAIVAGIALIWLQLWQLWNEAKGSGTRLRETITWSTIPPVNEPAPPTRAHEIIVCGRPTAATEVSVLAGRGIHGRMSVCAVTGSATGEPADVRRSVQLTPFLFL